MTDDKLYTSLSANIIMAKLTNHVQRTRFITSSTDKHYSLDSEDDFRLACRNVSHQQQSFRSYPHPDNHTVRTTDTPGLKPFTMKNKLSVHATVPSKFGTTISSTKYKANTRVSTLVQKKH